MAVSEREAPPWALGASYTRSSQKSPSTHSGESGLEEHKRGACANRVELATNLGEE